MTSPVEIGPLLEALAGESNVGVALLDTEGRYLFVNEPLAAIHALAAEEHLGRPASEVVPGISDEIEQYFERVRAGESVIGARIRGTAGGRTGEWLASYHPVRHDGVRAIGVVVVDITEQAEAEALAARRAGQHVAVAQLGQLGLEGLDLDALFDRATEALARELDVELTKVLELEADGRAALRSGVGWREGLVGHARVSTGDTSQAGHTLLTGGPVIVTDLRTETRFSGPPLLLEHGVVSGLSTVIRGAGGTAWGVIGAHTRRRRVFTDDEIAFLTSVANVLAASIERAATDAELRRLADVRSRLVTEAVDAADVERRRIADLLHDDALQTLLFLRQEVQVARRGPAPEALDPISDGLDAAIAALRRTVAELHPVVRRHAGLEPALQALADEVAGRSGLDVRVASEADAAGFYDQLILTLTRELLVNVVKHADAGHATVDVSRRDGRIVLAVTDDGRGTSEREVADAAAKGHVGLASCFHRAEALGGSGCLEDAEPRGTRVVIELPAG
jgi:PAS domain S-box-containing protein